MSMSNNIAEGSGSSSVKEFSQFLNIARRSTFENANILILLERRGLIKRINWKNYFRGKTIPIIPAILEAGTPGDP
jgi:four helix bundle protein